MTKPLFVLDRDGIQACIPYEFDEKGLSVCSRMSWEEIDEFRKKLSETVVK